MPRRGDKPGFKRGRRGLPYWMARQLIPAVPPDFPDPCIALPADASEAELRALCQHHTERLDVFIATAKLTPPDEPKVPRFDGSVASACDCYEKHPLSRFRRVKGNTRKSYSDSLKVIRRTVGGRVARNVTTLDCEGWYENWRAPDFEGDEEHVRRAHGAISVFRTVIRFVGRAYRRKELLELDAELKTIQFERGGAREQELTYHQVVAFIRAAQDLGARGVIPAERALALAIGVAAQFELMLRPMDVCGEWEKTSLHRRVPAGQTVISHDDQSWYGYFTWESLPGWIWRMRTSKSKYRAPAEFDLTRYALLFPLLEQVSRDERNGAVIKGEHGLPIRYRLWQKTFRKIARAAGIPDDVQVRDARPGGATEADEAGVPVDLISAGLTHSNTNTTLRYIRRRGGKHAQLADLRKASRTVEGDQ